MSSRSGLPFAPYSDGRAGKPTARRVAKHSLTRPSVLSATMALTPAWTRSQPRRRPENRASNPTELSWKGLAGGYATAEATRFGHPSIRALHSVSDEEPA